MDGLKEVLFRIVEDNTFGRYLVALRDIPAGKSIFTESPVAIGPPEDHAADDDLCIVCMSSLEHQNVCSRCFWPVCSSECGRSERHRFECATLSAYARQSEEELLPLRHLLVLRCVLLKNRDQYSWEKLLEMEDHHGIQSLIRSAEEELHDRDRIDLKYFVMENCGVGVGGDLDTVADIILSSKIMVDGDNRRSAFPALYLTGGLLSHSCVPNVREVFEPESHRLTAVAAVNIARGERLTRSAITGLMTKDTRRRSQELATRLISCCCKRCHDPTECGSYSCALLCQLCARGAILLAPGDVDQWSCTTCGLTVSADAAEALIERLHHDLETTKCEEALVKFKDFLMSNSGVLHPTNHLVAACKESLFFLKAVDEGEEGWCKRDKLETVDLGMDLLRLADKLEPGLSKMRGKLLLALGTNLQQILSQEILDRMTSPDLAELSERQIYSAFHDALFCFEEAKKIQRLDKSTKGKDMYCTIKSSIHVLKDMKKDFERTYVNDTARE